MKFLFVTTQGIGNLIAKLPAITKLYKDEKIDLTILTTELGNKVYSYFGIDCKKIIIQSWHGKTNMFYQALDEEFDVIFEAVPFNKGFFNGSKKSIQPEIDWNTNTEMAANLYAVSQIINEPMGLPEFGITKEVLKKESIGIHIGSTTNSIWKKKRWPNENWALLIRELNKAGYDITVYGTNSDFDDCYGFPFDYCMDKEFENWKSYINRMFDEPLSDVFDSIKHHTIFISNDSGLGKAATALGCKTFCIYGPTDVNKNRLHTEIPIYTGIECRPCQFNWEKFKNCKKQICFPEQEDVIKVLLFNIEKQEKIEDFKIGLIINGYRGEL